MEHNELKSFVEDEIYPLTIISDRYTGTYSGGEYLAFNLDFDEIPQGVLGDDVTAMEFWDYYSKDYIVGKGRTVSQALLDLYIKLKNRRANDGT